MKNKCKNCSHWKNGQRELNYWETTGFCTNPKIKFNINDGRLIGVFDRENRVSDDVTGNPSHDFEVDTKNPEDRSIYSLVTQDVFGCVLHKTK